MLIKKSIKDIDPKVYEELIKNSTGNLKKNLVDVLYMYQVIESSIIELWDGDKLLGAAKYNLGKVHLSLYNIFSFHPGTGTILLNEIWKDAFEAGVKYFRFWAYYDTMRFYDRFEFKYWDYTVTQKCLFAYGKILDPDPLKSNQLFNSSKGFDLIIDRQVDKAMLKCNRDRLSMKTKKHEPLLEEIIQSRKLTRNNLDQFLL